MYYSCYFSQSVVKVRVMHMGLNDITAALKSKYADNLIWYFSCFDEYVVCPLYELYEHIPQIYDGERAPGHIYHTFYVYNIVANQTCSQTHRESVINQINLPQTGDVVLWQITD